MKLSIERASLGETITHSLAKAIKTKEFALIDQQQVPLQAESITIDVSAETITKESLTEPEPSSTVKAQTISNKGASALPYPLDIEPDFLCSALLRNIESLSHQQINTLWQGLAHCTPFESQILQDLSDSILKRLTAAALEELNKRQ